MANVAALSKTHSDIIQNWVKEGGKLIATYQTSLFNEVGEQRNNFSLSDVFGVSYNGTSVNTIMDCYQKIITRNEILSGFEKTKLLHNGGRTLMVTPAPEATVITGYLPKINNQPPENAFPDSWNSPNPIAVLNNFGKGQTIYFANETAKLNYTVGHPDYNDLLKNSINLLLAKNKILSTNAPSSVHVYLNQSSANENIFQLSFVNTSSTSQRPYRDLVPVSEVKVHLPFDIRSIEPLLNETETKLKVNENTVIIDNLEEFYSLKIHVK